MSLIIRSYAGVYICTSEDANVTGANRREQTRNRRKPTRPRLFASVRVDLPVPQCTLQTRVCYPPILIHSPVKPSSHPVTGVYNHWEISYPSQLPSTPRVGRPAGHDREPYHPAKVPRQSPPQGPLCEAIRPRMQAGLAIQVLRRQPARTLVPATPTRVPSTHDTGGTTAHGTPELQGCDVRRWFSARSGRLPRGFDATSCLPRDARARCCHAAAAAAVDPRPPDTMRRRPQECPRSGLSTPRQP